GCDGHLLDDVEQPPLVWITGIRVEHAATEPDGDRLRRGADRPDSEKAGDTDQPHGVRRDPPEEITVPKIRNERLGEKIAKSEPDGRVDRDHRAADRETEEHDQQARAAPGSFLLLEEVHALLRPLRRTRPSRPRARWRARAPTAAPRRTQSRPR